MKSYSFFQIAIQCIILINTVNYYFNLQAIIGFIL